ncbi:MAG: type III PLP-dependent enzyme, partial [Candidatus Dormibacteraceae bacterium]
MIELPSPVRQLALQLAGEQNCLPAYVYDLAGLAEHVRRIRMALPAEVELFYAAKANSEIEVLDVLAGLVDGFEVSSGGELQHCYQVAPGKKLAFGGPGKRREELELALRLGVDRLHVESLHELRMLVALTGTIAADILLRINLSGAVSGAVLAMGGGPTPFGLDEGGLEAALDILAVSPQLRLRGLHAHLASGLQAPALLRVASRVVEFARKWSGGHGIQLEEINLGGGMGIDYEDPQSCFDWITFGDGLKQLIRPGEQLRIEP